MVVPPPRPAHYPRVGDPILVVGESTASPLVTQYITYHGEGRFAVMVDEHTRHIVKWDDDKGWNSILSWCRCK